MTQWAAFSGIAAVVLAMVLLLAYVSQVASDAASAPDARARSAARARNRTRARSPPSTEQSNHRTTNHSTTNQLNQPTTEQPNHPEADATHHADATHQAGTTIDSTRESDVIDSSGDVADVASTESASAGSESLSTGALLANVAFSQGAFCVLLLGGAWYTQVPLAALGLQGGSATTGMGALGVGIALGVGLYLVNELGTRGANAVGIDTPDALRASLAPESAKGWLVLLGGALPVVALFEELLFRAALVGVLAAGFGLSPWLLAAGSSVAFALGHGAQGSIGMITTGALGFVLASAFVLTGSLLVVVVAHYLVNALEFVVHR